MKKTIRFSKSLEEEIEKATRTGGFPNQTNFMRTAIESALRGNQQTALEEAEERLSATLRSLRNEVENLRQHQLALYALMDSFVKLFLTCVPEPIGEQKVNAIAAGQQRYDRFLTSAALSMNGNSSAKAMGTMNGSQR